MSLPRLDARLGRLEARHARVTFPARPLIVWIAEGDTRAVALQKAGLTPDEVAGRVVIFVQYEETRSDAS